MVFIWSRTQPVSLGVCRIRFPIRRGLRRCSIPAAHPPCANFESLEYNETHPKRFGPMSRHPHCRPPPIRLLLHFYTSSYGAISANLTGAKPHTNTDRKKLPNTTAPFCWLNECKVVAKCDFRDATALGATHTQRKDRIRRDHPGRLSPPK